ncbi:MAG: retropepsin-like aspartic protease [Pseudoxanthomonas sp.]
MKSSPPPVETAVHGRRIRHLSPRVGLVLCASILLGGASASTATSPLRFELDDNLIHVHALVNGQPIEAVLDSGSSMIVIDRAYADSHDISAGQDAGQAAGGGNGAQTLSLSTLSSLAFGPVALHDHPAVLLDLHSLSDSAGFPVQALFGRDVFAGRTVTIDYPARRLLIEPPQAAPACAAPIPYILLNGVPIITVSMTVTGQAPMQVPLIVDLGTRRYAAALGGTFARTAAGQALIATGKQVQVGTGTGGAVPGIRAVVAELRAGRRTLRDVPVAVTSAVKAFSIPGQAGSLGVPFWIDSRVTFDDARRQLCFTPSSASTPGAGDPGADR